MSSASDPRSSPAAALEQTLAALDGATAAGGISSAARKAARARAVTLFGASGSDHDAVGMVALTYASELLSLVAVDLAADPAHARRLITAVQRSAGVAPVALGRELLQTARLLELPTNMAIEIRLSLLGAFTEARCVGLWTLDTEQELALVSHAGNGGCDVPEHREAARRLLDGDHPPDGGDLVGAAIERLRPPPAVVLACGVPGDRAQAALLVGATVPVLSVLLDREALQAREQATQDNVVSAVERRLARLRFDLHDGPQQDVHLLAQDLRLFREQVLPMVAADPNADRLLGRLDDLEAQLVALDGDLRRLSSAVHSPFLTPGSLPDALRELTTGFAARTGVTPVTEITGSLARLTDSQQITLLALIREALSNIRKHSRAEHVTITIASDAQGIRAEITDDGDGFDPEQMLVSAARAGHLGLVGMHERVRMLGGRTHIDSRAGGPTVISATLPVWPAPDS